MGGKNSAFHCVPILFLSSLILIISRIWRGLVAFLLHPFQPAKEKDQKMRYLACLFLLIAVVSVRAQSLNKINFNYLYNQKPDVEVVLNPVTLGDSITVFFT